MNTNQPTTTGTLIGETATTYHISPSEAVDEVWDAIEILFPPEDRPDTAVPAHQAEAIREYIAEQYATNRTRL